MATRKTSKKPKGDQGIIHGYRSGLEDTIAAQLSDAAVDFTYEDTTIRYIKPETKHRYTPDFFITKKGIYIETKGRFLPEDRKKHLLIKQQHPDVDIRFVFTRSKSPIRKGSKTTYADWCEQNGFQYADKEVPTVWLQ